MAKDFSEFRERLISEKYFVNTSRERLLENIRYYALHLGVMPSIIVLFDRPKMFLPFPRVESIELAARGIIPYVNACIGNHRVKGPGQVMVVEKIPEGQYDIYIREFARGALEFGKEYGGFFLTTMEEANGSWYKWAGDGCTYIPAWKHIWNIFEELGANRYATWVWEAFCYESISMPVSNPEYYYPGDKYIDWIGINAYSVARNLQMNKSLYQIMHDTYRQMRKNHPQKPIMLSEFARTNEYEQRWWLRDAYSCLKNDCPAIRAAIYYDNVWTLTKDHTLNEGGLEAMREIFKDPYWITVK